MANLDKLLAIGELPKEVLASAERFLSTLFGDAAAEFGGLLADRVRFHRLRNQVRILQRAEEILAEAKLKPNRVSLKTLVPLLEAGSLEDNASVAELWARLLASVAASQNEEAFTVVCVQVLSAISPLEAQILDSLFKEFLVKPRPVYRIKQHDGTTRDYHAHGSRLDWATFSSPDIEKRLAVVSTLPGENADHQARYMLENLARLGIVKRGDPSVDDNSLVESDDFHFTILGTRVLAAVCLPPSTTIDLNPPRPSWTDA